MKKLRFTIGIALVILTAIMVNEISVLNSVSLAIAQFVIPLIMGLVTLLTTGSQMATQAKSRKEMKKYQNELDTRRSDYEAWFKGEYNQDFLDTEQGRSTLNQLGQSLKNTLANNQTSAVRTGATTESQVASQGAAQDVFAQALNQLTAQGTQYKQSLRNSYDYNIQNYLRPLDQMATGRVQNWNQLGGQIGDTGSGLITALGSLDWNSM